MQEPHRRPSGNWSDRALALVLFLTGLWVVFGPGWAGWDYLRARELEGTVMRLLIGSLFVFVAGTIVERRRTQVALGEARDALNMLVYGRNYQRDRDAIRILLKALRSKDTDVREKAWKSLRELTGCDFALDPEVWDSWWRVNEKRFALKTKRPAE